MAVVTSPCAFARGNTAHTCAHTDPYPSVPFTLSHSPPPPPHHLALPAVFFPAPQKANGRPLHSPQCSAYAASPPASGDHGNVDKLIAHLHYNLKEYSKSVEDILEALKSSPRDVELYILLSNAYAQMGLRNKAAQARRKAVQLEPVEGGAPSPSSPSSSARLALEAARLAMEERRWKEAIVYAEGGVGVTDCPLLLAELYKLISTAYSEMGDADTALNAQRLAVAACPEDKTYRIQLQLKEVEAAAAAAAAAASGSEWGSLQDVCMLASEGVQLCWDCRYFECLPDFHRARGKALLLQGNAEAALEDFSEYQRLKPEGAEPYLLMSDAFHYLERLKASVESLETAVKVDPGNEDAKLLLASRLAELLDSAAA